MRIYHYTDLNGLKGIIENDCFWATNFYFLNDAQELQHGMQCIVSSLEYLKDEFSGRSLKFIRDAMTKFELFEARHMYNISFCRDSDLLSQWRGYGAKQGVCLEFESEELFESLSFSECASISGEVIYTKPDSTPKAKSKITDFFRREDIAKLIADDPFHEIIYSADFARKATPFFKHESFSEEKEFRIVIQPINRLNNVKVRVNDYGLIPYLEIKAKTKLPLKSVKIGPCKDKWLMTEGIQFLLQSKGYTDIPCSYTETPYRG
ncbi:DUF2971 domain-containing protein (plasmid) [Buttiauxella sp. 3AFRM03]|uniref:DUF2971 domain-containing protein n=1 Tax=Buttiauxella sp. 3AFRM03 TaxID=2479367 RepID=UPI000EF7FF07|nr:DUF2971 domain-containing protein [Buttiauxella sp. 3AFRM03]AYN25661.1 DUF2971 domain-containing protein [Buttiauxella sp. 3AFRM03]